MINNIECTTCGKLFYKRPSHIKKAKTGNFCNRKCFAEYKKVWCKGENNSQFGLKGPKNASFKESILPRKNNRLIDQFIYVGFEHPYHTSNGRIKLHRYLVEQNYHIFDKKYFIKIDDKFYLKREIVVHHMDGDHNNNDISNLMPVTKSEHTSIHNKENIIIRGEKGRIIGVLKQGELLGNPTIKEDNQQPSLDSNIFEGSTTNNRVLPSKVEDSNVDTSALPNIL